MKTVKERIEEDQDKFYAKVIKKYPAPHYGHTAIFTKTKITYEIYKLKLDKYYIWKRESDKPIDTLIQKLKVYKIEEV